MDKLDHDDHAIHSKQLNKAKKLGPPPGFPVKTNLQVSVSPNVNMMSQDRHETATCLDHPDLDDKVEPVNDPQDPKSPKVPESTDSNNWWEYTHNAGHATTGSWENAHESHGVGYVTDSTSSCRQLDALRKQRIESEGLRSVLGQLGKEKLALQKKVKVANGGVCPQEPVAGHSNQSVNEIETKADGTLSTSELPHDFSEETAVTKLKSSTLKKPDLGAKPHELNTYGPHIGVLSIESIDSNINNMTTEYGPQDPDFPKDLDNGDTSASSNFEALVVQRTHFLHQENQDFICEQGGSLPQDMPSTDIRSYATLSMSVSSREFPSMATCHDASVLDKLSCMARKSEHKEDAKCCDYQNVKLFGPWEYAHARDAHTPLQSNAKLLCAGSTGSTVNRIRHDLVDILAMDPHSLGYGDDPCHLQGNLGNWRQWGEYPSRPTDVGSWNLSMYMYKYVNATRDISSRPLVEVHLDSISSGTCSPDLKVISYDVYLMVCAAYPLRKVLLYHQSHPLQEQKSKGRESVDDRIYPQKVWLATRLNILLVWGRHNTSNLQPNVKEDSATDCVRKKRDTTNECSVHEALAVEVNVPPGMSV